MCNGRPIDDFSWLAETLLAHGGHSNCPSPRRTSIPTVSGMALSGIRWGDTSPTVLYLHGGGQNAHTWDLVAAMVGTSSLALDLPGHGHSPWREDRDYHPLTNATTVASALETFEDIPRLIVGMSMGGLTALALAGLRPDLVERVILVDILPDIEAERLPRDLTDLGAVALLSGPREFSTFDAMVDAAIAAAGPGRSAANLRRGVWHNAKQTPTGYWVWRYDDLLASRSYSTSSLWACVAGMSSPLTLVKGGESPFITDAAIARLRQLRDDAEVIVVPGAGHSVQSAAPATLAALILERLSQATTSSSSNTA